MANALCRWSDSLSDLMLRSDKFDTVGVGGTHQLLALG